MIAGLRIEKLARAHRLDRFDCAQEPLNRFLLRHALQSQQSGASTTYVALDGDAVVGFHSLAFGQVEYADAPDRIVKGLARHAVPVMLLARLAVDVRHQRRRLGAGLLRDAVLRTLRAAEIAGLRALVVHAKDDAARASYGRFDFLPAPTDPYHLMILLKDLRSLSAR